jgi:hypothetical protein
VEYAYIVELIDAELARLREARQILLSLRLIQEEVSETTALPEPAAAAPILLPEAVPGVKIRKIETRTPARLRPARRQMGSVIKKSGTTSAPSALRGVVSQAPVFVPAEEIRQALAQKQQAIEPPSPGPSISDPITTEELARKWLHSAS